MVCCVRQGTAERQIVHVLMDCAAQEAAYNVFYSNLAVRMCQYHARFKFTLQLAFWDVFKKMGDLVVRLVCAVVLTALPMVTSRVLLTMSLRHTCGLG